MEKSPIPKPFTRNHYHSRIGHTKRTNNHLYYRAHYPTFQWARSLKLLKWPQKIMSALSIHGWNRFRMRVQNIEWPLRELHQVWWGNENSENLKNVLSETNYVWRMATTAALSVTSDERSFSAPKIVKIPSSPKLRRQKTFKFTNFRSRKRNHRQC